MRAHIASSVLSSVRSSPIWRTKRDARSRNTLTFAAYSANQSDYRKHVTSLITRHTPTRSRLHIIVYIIHMHYIHVYTPRRHTQSKQEAGSIPLQERTRESHSCLYAGTRCLRSFTNKLWQESRGVTRIIRAEYQASSSHRKYDRKCRSSSPHFE